MGGARGYREETIAVRLLSPIGHARRLKRSQDAGRKSLALGRPRPNPMSKPTIPSHPSPPSRRSETEEWIVRPGGDGERLIAEVSIGLLADGDLIAEAKGGDRAAFEIVVGPVLLDAFRLAMIMVNDRLDAEDSVQEAAFKAWKNFGRLKEGMSLRPWFLAIVANQCRDVLRRRWRSKLRLPGLAQRLDEQDAEPDLAGNEDVRRALLRLGERDRAILLLRYGMDMEIADVARTLEVRVPTAKSRIHRALARLRPELEIE